MGGTLGLSAGTAKIALGGIQVEEERATDVIGGFWPRC